MLSPDALAALHRLVAILLALVDALAAADRAAPRPLATRLATRAFSRFLEHLVAHLETTAADASCDPAPTPAPIPTRPRSHHAPAPPRIGRMSAVAPHPHDTPIAALRVEIGLAAQRPCHA